ncbi:hypothetical protein [Micromonospora sp. NPDC050695]|uniref:hypothetical protein n=1 Tax=Micromonospora sp. NPDC050695 TaxID=3154938 RepID=UPI0033FA8C30
MARLSTAQVWAWLGASPGFHRPSVTSWLASGEMSRCSSRRCCAASCAPPEAGPGLALSASTPTASTAQSAPMPRVNSMTACTNAT